MLMKWEEHNEADQQMLARNDLSPLHAILAYGNKHLRQRINQHNEALELLTARFDQLVMDRQRMTKVDNWLTHDGDSILTEGKRLVVESWNSLYALRNIIKERRELLTAIESHLRLTYQKVVTERDEAIETARKKLEKIHHPHAKSESHRGRAYINARVNDDNVIVDLDRRIESLRGLFSTVQSKKRHTNSIYGMPLRIRKVYRCMI